MTERQLAILDTAQQLFLKQGYHGTSTKLIANGAEVSEALIFKHFKHKDYLLATIFGLCEKDVFEYLNAFDKEEDPKEVLRAIIDLPFNLYRNNNSSLAFLTKLKMHNKISNSYLNTFRELLMDTFNKQRFKSPDMETEFLILVLEQVSIALSNQTINNSEALELLLLKKYHINSE